MNIVFDTFIRTGSSIFIYGPGFEYREMFIATDMMRLLTPSHKYSTVTGTDVVENCLQHYAAGLNAGISHEFNLQNPEQP
jgi:hypothetical protein